MPVTTNNTLPTAVIFDMDGLLVDSETLWAVAEREMIEKRGKVYNAEINLQFIGLRPKDFIANLKREYDIAEEVSVLLGEVIARTCDLVKEEDVSRPGANELIDWLREKGIPHAIASSSPMVVINTIVESHGWGDFFELRCSGDDVTHGKPAPDIYLAAARLLDVAPEQCLALEDSPTGAKSAVAAGITCYAVPDPMHATRESFKGVTPYVFDSLLEVLDDLKQKV